MDNIQIQYIDRYGQHCGELKGVSPDGQIVYVKPFNKKKIPIPFDHVCEEYKEKVLRFAERQK